jgi:3-hydroxy-9,10-secoandrosta-1,3,5(10)-triene-9,17-dione monooxygenase
VIEDAKSQEVCATAQGVLDATKAVLFRSFDELMGAAQDGEKLSIERRAQFRYESALAAEQCLSQVDALLSQSGGRAIFRAAAIQPFFQAAHAARAHYANNPAKPAQNFGRVLLGLPTKDFFL